VKEEGLAESKVADEPHTLPPLPHDFYARPTLDVARDLVGKTLWRRTGEGVMAGIIVETEGYIAAIDPAAHAYRGQTARNRVMFGPPGYAYVYFTYGMYHCLNAVTQAEGEAAAVLVRAIEPTHGQGLRRARRGESVPDRDLCRGPGRLCIALGLTVADNGSDLLGPLLWITETPGWSADTQILATPRIGISQAADFPWRFLLSGNPYVSGPKRPGRTSG
jgi:DNA-3-methyladenine glycosylase